jgi:SAM-dependent methyltransferase
MDAIHRGDLGRAVEIVGAIRKDDRADDRCDALAALSLLAATRADLEAAFGRSEQLLSVSRRASDPSWRRAAYALRSWLYFLARQAGEARAELDRSFERPGAGPTTVLPVLLAVSLGGDPQHVERLRQIGGTAIASPLTTACGALADSIEARIPSARARAGIEELAGSFLGAVVELQLAARLGDPLPPDAVETLARSQAQRLVELILRATPVNDTSVDLVISNGVINLAPDKRTVFREIFRVLKPGGRLQIADIVVHRDIPAAAREDIAIWTA